MSGIPKQTRARRNAVNSNFRMLGSNGVVETPDLIGLRHWHPLTLNWWADLWASPMASEYDESDKYGLSMLAILIDQYWIRPTPQLAAEIRMQRQCFGLTPIDRRKLQWEIDRGEVATEAVERRRQRSVSVKTENDSDPRLKLAE